MLDADIEGCFDNIDHTVVLDRVRGRIKDKKIVFLVRAFLKSGVVSELNWGRFVGPTRPPRKGLMRSCA